MFIKLKQLKKYAFVSFIIAFCIVRVSCITIALSAFVLFYITFVSFLSSVSKSEFLFRLVPLYMYLIFMNKLAVSRYDPICFAERTPTLCPDTFSTYKGVTKLL